MAHMIAQSIRLGRARMGSTKKEWHHGDTDHVVWEHSPTCDEVIADLDFNTPIEVRPIYDEDGNPISELRETWRPHLYPNGSPVMDDKGKRKGTRLGLVGPDYSPIQDDTFIRWFEPWIDAGLIELQSAGAIFNGSRVFALASAKRDPVDIAPNDPVASYIGLLNGHDMTVRFSARPTNIRWVCWNTVSAGLRDRTFASFGFKHRGDVTKKMGNVREALAAADGLFLGQCERFKALAGADVKDAATLKVFFQKILGAPKEEEDTGAIEPEHDDGRNVLPKLLALYEGGIGNKGKTWWDAYNAWTQFTTQIRGRTADARLEKMYNGTTAAQNTLALGFGLAALRGDNIGTMTSASARKLAMAA